MVIELTYTLQTTRENNKGTKKGSCNATTFFIFIEIYYNSINIYVFVPVTDPDALSFSTCRSNDH